MRPGSVHSRVQRWVVIHFELAIELETSLAVQNLLPQPVERRSQVVPLFRQNPQAFLIAGGMARRCSRTLNLFARVKKLE
jgi:hypothetical protein